jgi:hypothetical protein
MIPDYTKSVNDVFGIFATQYLNTTGDQTLLSFVIHDAKSLKSDIPSWVPRWNALEPDNDDRFWSSFSVHSRNVDASTNIETLVGMVLRICGSVLENVAFASEVLYQSTTSPSIVLKLWREIQERVGKQSSLVPNRFEDFFDALTQRSLFSDVTETERQIHMEIYEKGLQRLGDEVKWKQSEDAGFNYVHGYVAAYSNAKRLIVTNGGYFGLAPAASQEGDIVARLYGSRFLLKEHVFLLRTTKKSRHYRLVGPACIYFRADNEFEDEEGSGDVQDIYLC